MKVGVVGEGIILEFIVKNFSTAGFDVSSLFLNKEKTSLKDISQLLKETDVLVVYTEEEETLEDIQSIILRSDIQGKTVLLLSTIYPDAVKKFAEEVIKKGGSFLETPVLGSISQAEKGMLTVFVSGEEEIYKQVSPLLSVIAKNLLFVGDYTKATKLKVLTSSLESSIFALVCEHFVWMKKNGIDTSESLRLLEDAVGKLPCLYPFKRKVFLEDEDLDIPLKSVMKDFEILQSLSDSSFSYMPLMSSSKEIYKLASNGGNLQADITNLWETLKQINKVD